MLSSETLLQYRHAEISVTNKETRAERQPNNSRRQCSGYLNRLVVAFSDYARKWKTFHSNDRERPL